MWVVDIIISLPLRLLCRVFLLISHLHNCMLCDALACDYSCLTYITDKNIRVQLSEQLHLCVHTHNIYWLNRVGEQLQGIILAMTQLV